MATTQRQMNACTRVDTMRLSIFCIHTASTPQGSQGFSRDVLHPGSRDIRLLRTLAITKLNSTLTTMILELAIIIARPKGARKLVVIKARPTERADL